MFFLCFLRHHVRDCLGRCFFKQCRGQQLQYYRAKQGWEHAKAPGFNQICTWPRRLSIPVLYPLSRKSLTGHCRHSGISTGLPGDLTDVSMAKPESRTPHTEAEVGGSNSCLPRGWMCDLSVWALSQTETGS